MTNLSPKFVPLANTLAGSCLSDADWQAINMDTLCFSLESLLFKPGIDLLFQIKDLKQYLGGVKSIVINASSLRHNSNSNYVIKSPYDGSRLSFTNETILQLVKHLRPDYFLLPKDMNWESSIDEFTMPFVSYAANVTETAKGGVYFDSSEFNSSKIYSDNIYLFGDCCIHKTSDLKTKKILFIETDKPSVDALNGILYTSEGIIDIKANQYAKTFSVIQKNCKCPACAQGFSLAYWHHLLKNTPLLCQRFLIQHNNYWFANKHL